MKFLKYLKNNKIKYGIYEKNLISEISGNPIISDYNKTGLTYLLNDVKVLAPCEPSKIICIGRNYAAHAKEVGFEVPEEPCIFIKPPSSVIAPNENIIYPKISKRVDYEAELAVVIGKRAKNVSENKASEYVFGYTCLNDVTARDLQRKDGQWSRAKGFDTFCPIGPFIETELDPLNVKVQSKLNGKIRQDGNTKDMVFNVFFLVHYISQVMTLEPRDIIATGTPDGIGEMTTGDIIEVSVEGIGTLKNQVR